MMRLFVAVTPPPEALDELRSATAAMRSAHPELRWSLPAQWHLTLAFLGEVDDDTRTDLSARLGLYRRLSAVSERDEIEAFAAEMVDRFGPLPEEVKHLLGVVQIKAYCRKAGVAQVEAGPKGAVIAFRHNTFANPAGLVTFIGEHQGDVKVQKDHKIVFKAGWADAAERLKGVRNVVRRLAELAAGEKKAA